LKLSPSSKHWRDFVDTATVAWIALFVIGFIAFDTNLFCLKEYHLFPNFLEESTELFCFESSLFSLPQEWEQPLYIINWITWVVFAFDLTLKYIHINNYKIFLRKHWFDIILLIPFFRISGIYRFLILIRILKFIKIVRNYLRIHKK
jgi:hypothetical protein